MEPTSGYVLVLAQAVDEPSILESLLGHCNCSVVVAYSPDQAMHYLRARLPDLVILMEPQSHYTAPFVKRLRVVADQQHASNTMIIALTDVNAPSWLPHDENPGFDGFLVKPLSCDILRSLVQSAWIRRVCCAAA
jgi:CheY-like chemotaxis protein